MPPGRKVVRFAAVSVPVMAVLVLLYPLLLPPWEAALRGACNPVLGSLSPPLQLVHADEGGWRILRLDAGRGWERVFRIPAESVKQIHISLVLLPALLLGTPVAWSARLRVLGLGLVLLFVLQTAMHVAFVLAWIRFKQADPSSATFGVLTVLHATAGQVFPVVVWGLLTWRHWIPTGPGAGGNEDRATPGRNDPCPCDSGRKFKHCCGKSG